MTKYIILLLLLTTGCATTQWAPDDLKTVRVIESEASAAYSIIVGKTHSCALVSNILTGKVQITYTGGECTVTVGDETDEPTHE